MAELIAGICGSPRQIRDIASEAQSGLEDLADEYQSRGTSREEAERLAVDEFGAVEFLGPAYQEVLAIEESRRTALITTLVIASNHLCGDTTTHDDGSDSVGDGHLCRGPECVHCRALDRLS